MANRVSFIIQLKDQFGKVAAKVNRQFEGMKRNADKASRSITDLVRKGQRGLGDLGRKAARTGAIMTAGLTVPIALMGRALVNAASDATETANKFNAVFDDVSGKANQVADDFAKSFGLAGSTARKLIGDTGDLLVGFGFTGDAALDFSRRVNEAAADLTSFQNVEGGVASASAAITKGILGETESLKSLGIVVRQNTKEFRDNIASQMRANGITEQQARANVIFNQILKQSLKSVGDVNRTWEDYASVQRRSVERTKELKESFGRLLIPIATKVTNIMIKVVDTITSLSPAMKKTVLILAGVVAIGGPLLVVLGGIALAFSVISLPILAIGVAIGVLVAGFVLFKDSFAGIGNALKAEFEKLLVIIDILLLPLRAIGDLIGFIADNFFGGGRNEINVVATQRFKGGRGGINTPSVQAPSAPSQGAGGTLNGQITVMAEPGTQVRQTSIQARGRGLNIGMNMAAT